MYDAKFIKRDEVPGREREPGKWADWMDRLSGGEAVVLYPRDMRHLVSLRATAHMAAKAKGIKIRTHFEIRSGTLELYLWLA